MGTQLTTERDSRAWVRLAQRAGFRHCVRALVFAGAVGAAWLIGSSAASAHSNTDPTVDAPTGQSSGVERSVENNTWRADGLLRQQCTGGSSGVADPDSRNTGEAAGADTARDDRTTSKSSKSSSTSKSSKSQHHSTTGNTSNTDDPESTSRSAKCAGIEGGTTPEAASDYQASSPNASSQLGPEGTAATSPDPQGRSATASVDGAATEHPPLGSLAGETLGTAAEAVGQDKTVATAPVSHTAGNLTGVRGSPLADALSPVLSTADTVTRPVSGALADATRPVSDEVTGGELPRLGNTVHKLVPLPGAGLPPGDQPATPAPPVAPGVDLKDGLTSPIDSVDAALPKQARDTGPKDAVPASHLPGPLPLPAVPGSGVSYGNATGSQFSQQGGGVTATVTNLPIYSAPESSALLATAFQAALRDLAGEPAVSPD